MIIKLHKLRGIYHKTCSESASTTCICSDKKISGQYILYNTYYWGLYADYYVSYGQSSYNCFANYNENSNLIANSEICVGASNHVNLTV